MYASYVLTSFFVRSWLIEPARENSTRCLPVVYGKCARLLSTKLTFSRFFNSITPAGSFPAIVVGYWYNIDQQGQWRRARRQTCARVTYVHCLKAIQQGTSTNTAWSRVQPDSARAQHPPFPNSTPLPPPIHHNVRTTTNWRQHAIHSSSKRQRDQHHSEISSLP